MMRRGGMPGRGHSKSRNRAGGLLWHLESGGPSAPLHGVGPGQRSGHENHG